MNSIITKQNIKKSLLLVLLTFSVILVKAQLDSILIDNQVIYDTIGINQSAFFINNNFTEQSKEDQTTINYLNTGDITRAVDKGFEKSVIVGGTIGSASVSPSGAATYQIPIFTLPGTGGMEPSISMVYSSQSGNGILGMGWNLSGISAITRLPQTYDQDGVIKGISITNDDRFALDGNRLYAATGSNGASNTSYVTEVADFSMIYSYGITGQGPTWFKVITKTGLTIEYGNTSDSKYLLLGNSTIFTWYISKITNPNGHYMTFHYTQGKGEIILEKIEYTGSTEFSPYNTIQFTYETRPDVVASYIAGVKATKSKRLKFVTIKGEGQSIRKYEMNYAVNGLSYLVSVKEHGLLDALAFNPTTFDWEGHGDNKFEPLNNNSLWTSEFGLQTGWDEGMYPRLTGDVDGDGLADVVGFGQDNVFFYKSTGFGFVHSQTISGGIFTHNGGFNSIDDKCFLVDVNGDGRLDIIGFGGYGIFGLWVSMFNGTSFSNPELKLEQWFYSSDKKFVTVADVNGDGRTDIILFAETHGVYVSYSDGMTYSVPSLMVSDFAYYVGGWRIDKHPRIMSDVNGDGMSDIVGFADGGVKVSLSTGNGFKTPEMWSTNFGYTSGGWRVDRHIRELADVNGDGLADIIGFGENQIYVSLSTGTGFLPPLTWSYEFCINQGWTVKGHQRYLTDVNGDGMADIVGYGPTGVRVSLSKGNGFESSEEWSSAFGYNNYSNQTFKKTIADVNGDGLSDIVCFLDNGTHVQISRRKSLNQLISVTDGTGKKVKFSYDFITNKTIYQKLSDAIYPLIDFQGPLQVATSLEASNGIGLNTSVTTYTYKGAKIQKLGKGFLGFMSTTSSNANLNRQYTSTFEIMTAPNRPMKGLVYHVCLKTQSVKTLSGNIISTSSFLNQTKTTMFMNHFPYVSSSSQFDGTNSTAESKVFTYNSYGNVTKVETNFDNDATETLTNTYTLAGSSGNIIPNRISNTSIIKTIGSSPSFTQSLSITYDTKGNISQTSNGLQTTVHSLNGMGLPSTTTVTAGGESRSESFQYDSKYRFVTKVENAYGHKIINTYDGATALKTASTGIDGKTTTYVYDGFLRLNATQTPVGAINSTLNWSNGNGPSNSVYFKEVVADDSPTSRVYYDLLGRELRTEREHINGTLLFDNIYNSKGQLELSSSAYFSNGSPKWKTNTYDSFGRVISSTYNGQTTSIVYSGQSVTTTAPDGTTSTKTYNAAGNLITSQDNGGIISYTYHSSGQPLSIIYSGGATTTMEYDPYGRQTKLNDPSAGPTTYTYNGFGQIVSQTDARGNSYQMAYDNIGRITTKNGPTEAITYSYIASGNGIGQLQQETNATNGASTTYTYDDFGRATAIAETIDGQTFNSSFVFDQYGKNTQRVYPSGYTLDYGYYKGTLTSITENATQTAIWSYSSETALGQPKQYKLNNGNILVDYNYDGNDMLTQIKTGNIDDFRYGFNPTTGNLTYRKDYLQNLQEDFTYDNLNRLKTISSPAQQLTLNYATNGNILDKGLGTFSYDGYKLTGINQVSDQLPGSFVSNQAITYTPFNKVETVTQGSYQYTISYGTNNQRNKSELKLNGALKKTMYYLGTYEKEITPTGTREIHYIFSPFGVVAAAIKQNGVSSLYYLSTDHLGSTSKVFRPNGTIVERNSYDAWGQRRSSTNWSYTVDDSRNRILTRGFTFHEHLDEFNLINMNGRVYDPILGRFMSPDNYVQAPDFSQSFNRYSYCYNNPLIYTDPDGNNPFLIALGIIAGVNYMSGVIQNNWQFNPGNWDWNNTYLQGGFSSTLDGSAWLGYVTPPSFNYNEGSFSVNASPSFALGSNGLGFGGNFGGSFGSEYTNIGVNFGLIRYFYTPGANKPSTVASIGYGGRVGSRDFSLSLYSTYFYSSIGHSQRIGGIGVYSGKFSARYENDGAPFRDLFGPLLVGKGSDKYRTAAASIGWGDYSIGVSLYTGDFATAKMPDGSSRHDGVWYPHGIYSGGNADAYRMGALYFGNKNYRYGVNSEWVRHYAQNLFAHDIIKPQPGFLMMDKLWNSYFVNQTRNPYSLW
jgi:RHS repeat-associated protein